LHTRRIVRSVSPKKLKRKYFVSKSVPFDQIEQQLLIAGSGEGLAAARATVHGGVYHGTPPLAQARGHQRFHVNVDAAPQDGLLAPRTRAPRATTPRTRAPRTA
jgi:hypothetical protein